MNEVDFAIAFLLTMSVLTYSVVSVSNKLTGDFNLFTEKRLQESASSLSRQLLEVDDNKSLISNYKKIQASFQENGGYSHTESINLTIAPLVSKVHAYDSLMNEIPSTVANNVGSVSLSFDIYFLPDEKKYVNVFYEGAPTSALSFETGSNVSGVVLSEEDFYVLSQTKCSGLKSMSYGDAKNAFGITDNFNVSGCDYGFNPPGTANVIVRSTSMMIERSDGTLYSDFVRIEVW
jgi:hypothetical protein